MTSVFMSEPHSGSRATRLEEALGFKVSTSVNAPMLVNNRRRRPALLAEINMWMLLMAAPKGKAELWLMNSPARSKRS